MLMLKLRRRMATLLIHAIQRTRVAWFSLLSTNRSQGRPVRNQPVQIVGRGLIVFEPNVRIGVFPSPEFLNTYAYIEARNESASVTIGGGTWINNGFRCISEHTQIVIGRNCLIGANVELLDSDFHGLKIEERHTSRPKWAAPIRVGDNVFIGSNVRILKGVSVGSGSVIANSAVVIADVPANVIVAGVPARVVREIPL